MKSSQNFQNISFGNAGMTSRHRRNIFKHIFENVGDIDSRVHISGDVYIATVTSDDHSPFILFEGSEGAGLFSPKKLVGQSARLHFLLEHEYTKTFRFSLGKCNYCGEDNRPTIEFHKSPDNLLRVSYIRADEDDLEKDDFINKSNTMCDECLGSLLGVIYVCEDEIWHNLASAGL